jgi:hypothetical protein
MEAKRRYLQLLKERFNSGVEYKGKNWNWDTVIQLKTKELARFLLEESRQFSFATPAPVLSRSDTLDVRKRILGLSAAEAQGLGIGKSRLHCLRRNVKSGHPFKIHDDTMSRLRDAIQARAK